MTGKSDDDSGEPSREERRRLEAVEFAILERAGRFDNRRLLALIGNGPPAGVEVRCHVQPGYKP